MLRVDERYNIHLTRGDICSLEVSAHDSDGSDYTFKVGDVVRMQIMQAKNVANVLVSKVFNITREAQSVTISLSASDTTLGVVTSKPVTYWYEIELNPETSPQTIIGYDETGAREFILYPEGVDLNA